MRWRLYRLGQRVRAWLGAAPMDDFLSVARWQRDMHYDSTSWRRAMENTLDGIEQDIAVLKSQVQLLALKDAATASEKVQKVHG